MFAWYGRHGGVWVVLLYCLCSTLALEYEEGEVCQLSSRKNGLCRRFKDCTYAQKLLRSGERPLSCGFAGIEPIVCCDLDITENPAKMAPAKSDTAQLGPILVPVPNKGTSLSDKKCKQYYPKPDFRNLVVGGTKSLPREFPHMALIGFGPLDNIEWRCGGSLISSNFVLTAAHCLSSRDLGDAKWVRLGDLDLSTDEDDAMPQDRSVLRVVPYPFYKSPQRYHDIALLELDQNVTWTEYVSPACLPIEEELPDPTLVVTGWGKTEYLGSSSNIMMKLDMDYVPIEKCIEAFGKVPTNILPHGIQSETQICAGGTIGQDTCQGDSGGPLQIANSARTFTVKVHTIIGITSLGKACGLSASPGIYTRVFNYVPWIETIVWPNEKV